MSCGKCKCNILKSEAGFTRRIFLKIAGALGIIAGGTTLWTMIRPLIPNVLYEPSKKVKVGTVESLPDGVSFHKKARAFVVKEVKNGKLKLHAISAICTHLGCIVQYTPGQMYKGKKIGFSCACHGSLYEEDGDVIKGPAPKALPWLEVYISPDDKKLVINTAKEVKQGTYLTV